MRLAPHSVAGAVGLTTSATGSRSSSTGSFGGRAHTPAKAGRTRTLARARRSYAPFGHALTLPHYQSRGSWGLGTTDVRAMAVVRTVSARLTA